MKDWLIDCEPRQVQLEAISRSYRGLAVHDALDSEPNKRAIPGYAGKPFKGWGHFLEMRLGKTPMALNEFMLFRRDYGFKKMIINTPNKFKEDWPLEAKRFGVDVPCLAFDSNKKNEVIKFLQQPEWLLAINYEALIQTPNVEMLLSVCGPDTYNAADESITIKSNSSKIFKGTMAVAKQCGVRRALSGKPITQGAHDLWSQLRYMCQIEGWDFTAFKNTFCQTGGFKGKQIIGIKNEDRLRNILDLCSFKARKVDWLKTPGVDYTERRITLAPEQLTMYKRMQNEFLLELENGTVVSADQIITKLMKMQQISSGFIFDDERNINILVPPEKNAKINEVRSMLQNELTTKLILVCHYRPSIKMLGEALAEFNPTFIMRGVDPIPEKARFNNDRGCRVIIGQEQSLRYGHTLMGNPEDPCYTTLFYENDYSLNNRSQCEERNQGVGQEQPITIVDFICTREDRRTIESLQKKEDVAANLMGYDRATGILPRSL